MNEINELFESLYRKYEELDIQYLAILKNINPSKFKDNFIDDRKAFKESFNELDKQIRKQSDYYSEFSWEFNNTNKPYILNEGLILHNDSNRFIHKDSFDRIN